VKSRGTITVVILLAFAACFLWLKWKRDEPRRYCLNALQDLCVAIDTDPSAILHEVIIPEALASRTGAEQIEFLTKALKNEISTEGIAALKSGSSFGTLITLFPNEAVDWTKQAGLNPTDCVAFRMERAGIRAEVVLAREGQSYRIVRCNNVKQMAPERGHS
jgi:hypothetical protein